MAGGDGTVEMRAEGGPRRPRPPPRPQAGHGVRSRRRRHNDRGLAVVVAAVVLLGVLAALVWALVSG